MGHLMKSHTPKTATPADRVDELFNGDDTIKIEVLFAPEQIAEAFTIIMEHSEKTSEKVTHFQEATEHSGKIDLQCHLWNLLAKGDVFSDSIAHPALMDVLHKLPSTKFVMGSIATNRILPSGLGQGFKVNYPYCNYHKPKSYLKSSMGCFK